MAGAPRQEIESRAVDLREQLLRASSLSKAPCAPGTLEMMAQFSVLSRLKEPENSSLFSKMRVYDGESLKDTDPKAKSVQEYRDFAGTDEGMNGVSTRFAYKILSSVFNYDQTEVAANPVHLMYVLEQRIAREDLPEETARRYLDFINSAGTRMRRLLDDLLSFVRLEQPQDAFTDCDLNVILSEIQQDMDSTLRLRNGTISNDDRRKLVEKAAEISQAPLFVDDTPSRTMTEIAAAARRLQAHAGRINGLELVEASYPAATLAENGAVPLAGQAAHCRDAAPVTQVPARCLVDAVVRVPIHEPGVAAVGVLVDRLGPKLAGAIGQAVVIAGLALASVALIAAVLWLVLAKPF